jgi:transposase
MPSQAEKNRRKALVNEIVQRKRQAEEARMPLSRTDLTALFDYLDGALVEGCDHSLRLTRRFLGSLSISEEAVISWLGEFGGYCDCEVLANVEDAWPSDP